MIGVSTDRQFESRDFESSFMGGPRQRDDLNATAENSIVRTNPDLQISIDKLQ